MFGAIQAWRERRQALRELAGANRTERERDIMRFQIMLERLHAAMNADQRSTALSLWHEIKARFYSQALLSDKVLEVLLKLGEFDDTERLMTDGLAKYPREQHCLVGHASVAALRGDIPTALERWAIVRKRFPFLALGYARTAACLVKANRLEEADAMLAQGIRKSPDDVFCLIEHARVAEARGNFEEALSRWQHLRDVQEEPRHPTYQNGTIGLGQCLRKMGRLDEAEALLSRFVERFGAQEVTLMELAHIARDRGDMAEAIKRWQRVKAIFPMLMAGYLGQIEMMKASGQRNGIESVLCELMDRLPTELGPACDYAALADERGDQTETARRWLLVNENFPDFEVAYIRAADALVALGREGEAEAVRAKHSRRFRKTEPIRAD